MGLGMDGLGPGGDVFGRGSTHQIQNFFSGLTPLHVSTFIELIQIQVDPLWLLELTLGKGHLGTLGKGDLQLPKIPHQKQWRLYYCITASLHAEWFKSFSPALMFCMKYHTKQSTNQHYLYSSSPSILSYLSEAHSFR